MRPDISVVVPTYRRPELLARCLDALERQDLEPDAYEILVVGDGPGDPARGLAAARGRVRFLELSEKRGPASARNLGWRSARGGLIAFTDDDCVPDSGWLRALREAWNGRADAVLTGSVRVPLPARPTDHARNTARLEQASFVTANCACAREALERVGGFDERFTAAWREDSDLEFRLRKAGLGVTRVPGAEVVHPVRPVPWGASLGDQKKGIFNAMLYRKHPDLYRREIARAPQWDYYGMLLCLASAAAFALSGRRRAAGGALAGWAAMQGAFMRRRLHGNSLAPSHVAEMAATSLAIPFLSIYWQWRGAWREGVFLP